MSGFIELLLKLVPLWGPMAAVCLFFLVAPAQLKQISHQKRIERQVATLELLLQDLLKLSIYRDQKSTDYTIDLLYKIIANSQISQCDAVVSAVGEMLDNLRTGPNGSVNPFNAANVVRDELRNILHIKRASGSVPTINIPGKFPIKPRDSF